MKRFLLPLTLLTICPLIFGSTCQSDLLDREGINNETQKLIGEILNTAQELSATEVSSSLSSFAQSMLDKGHLSWVAGYQSNQKKAGKDINEARYKPLPKGTKSDELVAKVQSIPAGPERAAFLEANGYRIVPDSNPLQLEQNINQDPSKLFAPLHTKLNGVHERYAKVLANLVSKMTSEKNTQVSASQVEALSTEIHYIWMKDASWKVQEVLEKFGIPKDQFYSLPIEDVISASEKALVSSEAASLEEKEVAALQQFTAYANLSEANKLLDDKILLDHTQTLLEIIQKAKN